MLRYRGEARVGEGVLGRDNTMFKCPEVFKSPNPAVFEELKMVQLNREGM